MFCKNCGNFIGESDKFCQSCGAEISPDTNDSASQTPGQSGNQVIQQTMQKPLGMKWYKFIVYVQLFMSMLMSVGYGYSYFSDTMRGDKETWKAIYAVFPKLRALNIVFGIIQFLYVGFLAVIWYRMFYFKKNAPVLYITNYFIQIALEWVWLVIAIAYTGMGYDKFSSTLSNTMFRNCIQVIYILLNIVYFKKRKFMFTK